MNIQNPILPGFNPDPSIVRVGDDTPGQRYDFVFVDQLAFEKHVPKTFAALATAFTDCKG